MASCHGKAVGAQMLRAGLLTVLVGLSGCATEREMAPLGPRTLAWLGAEKTILTQWGKIREDDPLRLAITDALRKKGVALVSSDTASRFSISAHRQEKTRSEFEDNPIKSSHSGMNKIEIIGDDQRCFARVNEDKGRTFSIDIIYGWDFNILDVRVAIDCLGFAFGQ
jgi:hypothetical protein